jgi:ADP-heptose:LPS heptosyltransferase
VKIIILKRDKLGDLLITTPAIQVLRQHLPEAKISLAASTYSSWVVKDAPFIDKIYSYPQNKSLSIKSLYFAFMQAIIFIRIRLECNYIIILYKI